MGRRSDNFTRDGKIVSPNCVLGTLIATCLASEESPANVAKILTIPSRRIDRGGRIANGTIIVLAIDGVDNRHHQQGTAFQRTKSARQAAREFERQQLKL